MSRFSFRRPVAGHIFYLLLFALYIAVFLNIAFYRQAFSFLPVNTLYNALVFVTLPVVAFCVINIVITLASFLWLDKLVITLFILLASSAQYFILNFGVVIDRGMITNILDTTPAESFALLSTRMVLTLLLSGLLAVFIAWWIRVKTPHSALRSVGWRIINILVSALLILAVALLFYKDYASLFRNHKELVKSLNPSDSIVAINSWYSHNKLDNLPLVRIGEDATQKPVMKNGVKRNLTIVVLGETSRDRKSVV